MAKPANAFVRFTALKIPFDITRGFFVFYAVIGFFAGWLGALCLAAEMFIHELGHARAAKRQGFRAKVHLKTFSGSTTWVGWTFGNDPEFSRKCMIVSAAGPVASLLWVLALSVTYVAFPIKDLWIGVAMCAVRAVFNMLPFWPLDGAKVLVSYHMWKGESEDAAMERLPKRVANVL